MAIKKSNESAKATKDTKTPEALPSGGGAVEFEGGDVVAALTAVKDAELSAGLGILKTLEERNRAVFSHVLGSQARELSASIRGAVVIAAVPVEEINEILNLTGHAPIAALPAAAA